MDKFEYQIRLAEMNKLVADQDDVGAAKIADSIDWRRVKSVRTLIAVSEIYVANKRFEDARDVLVLAYSRAQIGRQILYRLVEVSIKLKEFDEAVDFYTEFVQLSPSDNSRYILKYKIYKGRGSSIEEQIKILEDYKKLEYTERYSYELAKLYSKADKIDKCIQECDDIVLWFREGKYVNKAMELKMKYAPLTKTQRELYDKRNEIVEQEVIEEVLKKEQEQKESALENQDIVADMVMAEAEKAIAQSLANEFRDLSISVSKKEEETKEKEIDDNQKSMIGDGFGKTIQLPSEEVKKEFNKERANLIESEEASKDEQIEKEDIKEDITESLKEETKEDSNVKINEESKEEAKKDVKEETMDDFQERLARSMRAIFSSVSPRASVTGFEENEQEETSDNEQIEGQLSLEDFLGEDLFTTKENQGSKDEHQEFKELLDYSFDLDDELQALALKKEEEDRKAAEEKARLEAEEKARLEAEEKARLEAEQQAKIDSEEQARLEAEEKARLEAEEQARLEAEQQAKIEAEEQARLEAEQQAKIEAEESVEIEPEFDLSSALEAALNEYLPQDSDRDESDSQEDVSEDSKESLDDEDALEDSKESLDDEDVLEDSEESLDDEDVLEDSEESLEEESNLDLDELDETEEIGEIDEEVLKIKEDIEELDSLGQIEETLENALENLLKDIDKSQKEQANEVWSDETDMDLDEVAKRKDDEEIVMDPVVASEEKKPIEEKPLEESNDEEDLDLTEEQKSTFSYFAPVQGMTKQLARGLACMRKCDLQDKTSRTGNIIVLGEHGTGKTVLALRFLEAVGKDRGMDNIKIKTIDASDLNNGNVAALIGKMNEDALVIQRGGMLNESTANELSQAMEFKTNGLIVLIEDEKVRMRKLLADHPDLNEKFTCTINIPIFTNDELVSFGKSYVKELDYKIDDMGILALYNEIGESQSEKEPVTVAVVKGIIDRAIKRSNRFGITKLGRILLNRRYDKEDRIILYEKDFR